MNHPGAVQVAQARAPCPKHPSDRCPTGADALALCRQEPPRQSRRKALPSGSPRCGCPDSIDRKAPQPAQRSSHGPGPSRRGRVRARRTRTGWQEFQRPWPPPAAARRPLAPRSSSDAPVPPPARAARSGAGFGHGERQGRGAQAAASVRAAGYPLQKWPRNSAQRDKWKLRASSWAETGVARRSFRWSRSQRAVRGAPTAPPSRRG